MAINVHFEAGQLRLLAQPSGARTERQQERERERSVNEDEDSVDDSRVGCLYSYS